MTLTQLRLKELLDYDHCTGTFRRLVRTSNSVKIGDVAGGLNNSGYIQIRIGGKLYKAHHLAWLYVHGFIPSEMDHLDHDRTNNAIINLRPCTRSQNLANSSVRNNTVTGLKGVRKLGKKYQARISVKGRLLVLGCSNTETEAHAVYMAAAEKYYGVFCYSGSTEGSRS